jgi:glycosyltransferase involved in cell wall biosynthesis
VAGYGELWARGVRCPLRIAGDGSEADRVARAVRALPRQVADHVELLGRVSEDDKTKLLATSQVLVLPSRREGFPVVVAEAMASGLPVATVDRPDNGTRTVVDDLGIGTVGRPTPAGVADAVEAALADWDRLSARAQAAAPEFDWDRVVDRLLEQTRSLLEGSAH